MKRRSLIRTIAFFTAAIVATAGFWYKEKRSEEYYKQMVENQYSAALSELNSGLNLISVLLEKASYCSTPVLYSQLATELFSVAEISKNALSVLPSGGQGLETVNRFLSQVGNFTLSISGSIIRGQQIDAATQNNFSKLSKTAERIRQTISDSHLNYNNREHWSQVIESTLQETVTEDSLASSLTELEENLTDYPTLVYDGPFSDHILTKKAVMITGLPVVAREEAMRTAEIFCGLSENTLQFQSNEDGKIPAYRFEGENRNVSVSQNGGKVVYFRNSRQIDKNLLNVEQAIDSAKRFLNERDISSMQETYYFIDEDVCVINFAFLDGQTLCYTDLIKVGVALDNGEVVFYEANGYLFNHTTRAFEVPKRTAAEASQVLSNQLTIRSTSIVLIPTDGGGEKRCYEFLCQGNDEREILVYVDLLTGMEEQILILLRSDNGILVK